MELLGADENDLPDTVGTTPQEILIMTQNYIIQPFTMRVIFTLFLA